MVKTSITSYVVAGIISSCVIAVFLLFYVYADFNYDIEGIDTSGLSAYGNFSKMVSDVNESTSMVYSTNADSSLFDVLGGLVVKALGAIKSLISGIKFMFVNIGTMLGSGLLMIPSPIKIAIISILGVLIASALLFRYFSGKEDEK